LTIFSIISKREFESKAYNSEVIKNAIGTNTTLLAIMFVLLYSFT